MAFSQHLFAHQVPTTLAFLFLEGPPLTPTSDPLHFLFPLIEALFSQIFVSEKTSVSFRAQLKDHLSGR